MSESRPCCEVQTPQRTNKGKLIQAPWNEGNLRKPTDEAGFAWIHVTDPFLIGKTDSLWNRNRWYRDARQPDILSCKTRGCPVQCIHLDHEQAC